jgi:hypothetical protein
MRTAIEERRFQKPAWFGQSISVPHRDFPKAGVPPFQSLDCLCRLQEDVTRGRCVKARGKKVRSSSLGLVLPLV